MLFGVDETALAAFGGGVCGFCAGEAVGASGLAVGGGGVFGVEAVDVLVDEFAVLGDGEAGVVVDGGDDEFLA
mgnify:FL=1